MIRLIVNADDLGLHPRIDEGILAAHREGIVTSSSVLVTGRHAQQAIEAAKRQKLATGVHLCVTTHLPVAAKPHQVRWLAPGGRFRRDWREFSVAWLAGLIPSAEVEIEFEAQLERARALGATVDHLDTHQHVHLLPGMARVIEGLAARHGLPVRWPMALPSVRQVRRPGSLAKATLLSALSAVRPTRHARRVKAIGMYESGGLTEARLLRLLGGLSDGDTELMCHPGRPPDAVPEDPSWQYHWECELSALCSERVKEEVARRNITLVNYGQLFA